MNNPLVYTNSSEELLWTAGVFGAGTYYETKAAGKKYSIKIQASYNNSTENLPLQEHLFSTPKNIYTPDGA